MTGFDPALLAVMPFACAVGFAAGVVHFRSLSLVTRLLVSGNLWGVFLQLGRLAGLGVVFWGLSTLGAAALICALAGLLIARARVLARMRSAP